MGHGVLGPPWQDVPELSAEALSLDPPVTVACNALAVWHSKSRVMLRCANKQEAEYRATMVSAQHGGTARVLRGAVQLRSGLWYFPVEVSRKRVIKALDPLDREDRAVLIKRIQQSLLKPTRASEARMLARSLKTLKVGWNELTERQMRAVMATVSEAAKGIPAARGVQVAVRRSGPVLVSAANGSRRARILGVRRNMALPDERAVKAMTESMPFFMRNEYGRRASKWAERDARDIISRGIRDGLDDRVIGKDLHKALGGRVTGRTEHYMRTVASVASVRASSFGQLTGYVDAGIATYEWNSVLDEATCPVCVFMHGHQFSVADAASQFSRVQAAADPEDGVAESPFFRMFEGNIHVGPAKRGGTMGPMVARAVEGTGQATRFAEVRSPAGSGGTEMPPAHELCRCVTLPVF